MKKLFFSFSAFLLFSLAGFWGCEKDFDGVVDFQNINLQVEYIATDSSFTYSPYDSLINIRLKLVSVEGVNAVFANVYSSTDSKLNSNPVFLFDNGNMTNGDSAAGDKVFSNKFPLSTFYPNGKYKIDFFVTDKNGNSRKTAVHYFNYTNTQINVAPVISNLIIPDIIQRGATFVFSVAASDANSLGDIQFVYFQLFRPDSTIVEENPGDTIFSMHDDGNSEMFGDETAGDGIYSFKNSFLSTTQTGTWRFEFQAIDRQGETSNKIVHNIIVE